MPMKASVTETEVAKACEWMLASAKNGSRMLTRNCSPIQPSAKLASVMPSCVAER